MKNYSTKWPPDPLKRRLILAAPVIIAGCSTAEIEVALGLKFPKPQPANFTASIRRPHRSSRITRSGFLLDSVHLATTLSNLDGLQILAELEVWRQKLKRSAIMVAAFPAMNLAILRMTATTTPDFLPISTFRDSDLKLGTKLWSSIAPPETASDAANERNGVVLRVQNEESRTPIIQTNLQVTNAYLGSPVFNEESQIVGMISQTTPPPYNASWTAAPTPSYADAKILKISDILLNFRAEIGPRIGAY